jgi:hypothetical protein
MKLDAKKYIFGPIILIIIAFIISPLLNVSHNSIILDNKDSNTSNSSSDRSILNTIIENFNLDNRAFAECNVFQTFFLNACTIDTSAICVAENSTQSDSITASGVNADSGGNGTPYPVTISINSLTAGITVLPLSQDFNNFPSGTPDNQTKTLNFDATGPTVSVSDDPGDASGPYGGLGRKKFTAVAHADFKDWNGSIWGSDTDPFKETSLTIYADHVNNAPVINTISSDYSATVANSSILTDVPVSFSFSDVESNHMNVVVDLSNDNFSTILQTHTFSNTATGSMLDYTFTSLVTGTYQWRVTATETDAVGTCAGFSNVLAGSNLQVSATKSISLTVSGSPTNPSSGSVNAPSCSNQKPGIPSGLTAVSGPRQGQETLNWIAPQGPVTDYSVSYSDDPSIKKYGVVSTGNVTSYVISGLGGGRYYFWVNAVNGCMSGDPVSPTIPTLAPSGPENIIKIGILGIMFMLIGGAFLIFI